MGLPVSHLTDGQAWRALAAHHGGMGRTHLRELFEHDPGRATRYTIECGELYLDFSRHRINDETLRLLVALAEESGLAGAIARLFAGDAVNASEGRPALHMALRAGGERFPQAPANDVLADVRKARAHAYRFADALRQGRVTGATGKPLRHVVNLGVGGSDLGPRLLVRALRSHASKDIGVHFVANADPADLDRILAGLRADETLFIVASKTFTTVETLSNARRAREWVARNTGGGAKVEAHFAAVTVAGARAVEWGVPPDRIFPIWDWVGGRFSLWSAVGLPAMISAGPDNFDALLAGARDMDAHFRDAPFARNMPVILALLSIWYSGFFGAQSHVLLPYAEDLRAFPAWVQQLHMESNGKSVDREGVPVDYPTAPVIWGATGTLSQHSFHQLLHQGTRLVPADFIIALQGEGDADARRLLLASALAQGSVMMTGAQSEDPSRALPGNRPSSTLLMNALEPRALGQLLALYEHKVIAEAAILRINAFDQWGVEYGKSVAQSIERGDAMDRLDASTRALLARARRAGPV
jgi:glucose-6-phosphate isomerase